MALNVSQPERSSYAPNWDAATDDDLFLYRVVLEELLQEVRHPDFIGECSSCSGNTRESHNRAIDDHCNSLISCCMRAARVAIPNRRRRKRVAFWSERVSESKSRSILWHKIWEDSGCPRTGLLFEIMKKAKAEYKHNARQVLKNQKDLSSQRMGEAMASNNSRDFWGEVKRTTGGSRSFAAKMDDAEGPEEICHLFANKYQTLYNCVEYDSDAMSSLVSQMEASVHFVCERGLCYAQHSFSVADVKKAVERLKPKKADAIEGFMSDNVVRGCG